MAPSRARRPAISTTGTSLLLLALLALACGCGGAWRPGAAVPGGEVAEEPSSPSSTRDAASEDRSASDPVAVDRQPVADHCVQFLHIHKE